MNSDLRRPLSSLLNVGSGVSQESTCRLSRRSLSRGEAFLIRSGWGARSRSVQELTLASTSSRFLRRQTELDHFSPLLRRTPLHALRERRRYVKLNHSCHKSILLVVGYLAKYGLTDPFQCPCHSHPHSQRTESINLSFFRSALHTAHDLIHMFLLLYSCTQIGLAGRGSRCSAVVI